MHTQGYCHVNVKTGKKQQLPAGPRRETGTQDSSSCPSGGTNSVNASISDIQPQDWTMFKSLILRYLARPKSLKSGRLLTPGR